MQSQMFREGLLSKYSSNTVETLTGNLLFYLLRSLKSLYDRVSVYDYLHLERSRVCNNSTWDTLTVKTYIFLLTYNR